MPFSELVKGNEAMAYQASHTSAPVQENVQGCLRDNFERQETTGRSRWLYWPVMEGASLNVLRSSGLFQWSSRDYVLNGQHSGSLHHVSKCVLNAEGLSLALLLSVHKEPCLCALWL